MFEHHKQPLISRKAFAKRVLKSLVLSTTLIVVSLLVGIIGYRMTEGMDWIDSLLNASMILSGMGPAATLQTSGGKLFASFYALFSGIIFISSAGVIVAPIFHRITHSFHADMRE